jgi:hypothetical protein
MKIMTLLDRLQLNSQRQGKEGRKLRRSPMRKGVVNRVLVYLTGAAFSLILSCGPGNGPVKEVGFRACWDTVKVLENPGKGWYHHMPDNGVERYLVRNDSLFDAFPGMDHIYIRLAWSFLEPEEGRFDWRRIDSIVDKYVPLGYGISFRISCKERRGYPNSVAHLVDGVHYATPYWVKQAGAKGQVSLSKGTEDVLAWSPDWDDPLFLEKLENFHRAFAERYDGKPWVRYVDVGSIGDYGEGHTSASTRIPPTVDEVKANIDVHLRNYKYAQLVVTDDLLYYGKEDDEVQELYDYAVSNGITLRDDSPMVGWYVQKYMDTWTISHPRFYDPLYLQKPVVFELSHYNSVKRSYWMGRNGRDILPELGVSGAEIFLRAIETMHATYIGYHGYAEDFLTDNPELAGELLNRCGYWYFPVSARFSRDIYQGSQSLSITWLNKGVAPSYRNFSMVLCLDPEKGGQIHRIVIPDAGNTAWLPGAETTAQYTYELTDRIEKGEYLLKMKLKDTGPEDMQRDVFLGVSDAFLDQEHYMILGKVRVH